MREERSVSMRGVGLGSDPSRGLRMTMRGNEGNKMDPRLKMSGMTCGERRWMPDDGHDGVGEAGGLIIKLLQRGADLQVWR